MDLVSVPVPVSVSVKWNNTALLHLQEWLPANECELLYLLTSCSYYRNLYPKRHADTSFQSRLRVVLLSVNQRRLRSCRVGPVDEIIYQLNVSVMTADWRLL